MNYKIMVVDDESAIRETISDILHDHNYRTVLAEDGESAEKKLLTEDLDVIILDVMLPNKGGLELLDMIHTEYPLLPTIIISGHGNIRMAVNAMKRGAFDFIEKPLSVERILNSVKNAIRLRELQTENINLRSRLEKPPVFVGESPVVKDILDQIPNIAGTDASVLITGENGTGKEMIARLIHLTGSRKSHNFVAVNCAAIPETLIESELFGHEKGAFTGANKQKKGKFEAADKGTIFLDEIGDLSLPAQAKVLRVLQEKELQRIGGNENIIVDVRVLAATNKDLSAEIEAGRFREDLFYRLNVIPLHLPPLRERKEDIPVLVSYFVREIGEKNGKKVTFSKAALSLLANKSWPGNVRELRNFIERLIILSTGQQISKDDILRFSAPTQSMEARFESRNLKDAKHEFEKGLIINRLLKNNMNITKTAESLEIERTYLHKKIKELEIDSELNLGKNE